MMSRTRRVAAALAGALALGGGSAAWAASAGAAPPAVAVPRCSPARLAVWVDADSADGAAGTTYYYLGFTNTGNRACSLSGYPGVSAVTSGGEQIGAAAKRTGAVPSRTVTIAPDGTAHSVLGYVDGAVANCRPAETAFYLRVYPPGGTTARQAFFPEPACPGKTADLVIERIAPGA